MSKYHNHKYSRNIMFSKQCKCMHAIMQLHLRV
uniref:Uncharacterized protein n=1 Tax=Arundo donax TaxID=35708 RepID=A0A0A9HM08_ARUDO